MLFGAFLSPPGFQFEIILNRLDPDYTYAYPTSRYVYFGEPVFAWLAAVVNKLK